MDEDIVVENDYDDVLIDIKITILQQFTSLNTFFIKLLKKCTLLSLYAILQEEEE